MENIKFTTTPVSTKLALHFGGVLVYACEKLRRKKPLDVYPSLFEVDSDPLAYWRNGKKVSSLEPACTYYRAIVSL